MDTDKAKAVVEQIAKGHLGMETLDTRNSDSKDFHELSVWDVREALLEAYRVGCRACGGAR